MKRLLVFVLTLVFILCLSSVVNADYKGEILFRDIPWGTSFSDITNVYGEKSSITRLNVSVDKYRIKGLYELVSWFPDKKIEWANSGITADVTYTDIKVAGYKLGPGYGMFLYFAFLPDKEGKITEDMDNTALFAAQYIIDTGWSPDYSEILDDLIEKLEGVYGPIYTTHKDTNSRGYEYSRIWKGTNDTYVCLRYREERNLFSTKDISIIYMSQKYENKLKEAYDVLRNGKDPRKEGL